MIRLKRVISYNVAQAINYLLPPVCGNCGEVVLEDVGICSHCWKKLSFISSPCCHLCGYPFNLSIEVGAICGECERRPKSFAQCRASLVYDDHCKDMIIGYKHGDKTYLAKLFSKWMALSGGEVLERADIIIPVPLHPRRLLSRKYNQAALIAQDLARLNDKQYVPNLLIRSKNTKSQGHVSYQGRWKNVSSAFHLNKKYSSHIKNKRIVIVDDVYTTGATLDACAKALKQEEIKSVDGLVLARVTKE